MKPLLRISLISFTCLLCTLAIFFLPVPPAKASGDGIETTPCGTNSYLTIEQVNTFRTNLETNINASYKDFRGNKAVSMDETQMNEFFDEAVDYFRVYFAIREESNQKFPGICLAKVDGDCADAGINPSTGTCKIATFQGPTEDVPVQEAMDLTNAYKALFPPSGEDSYVRNWTYDVEKFKLLLPVNENTELNYRLIFGMDNRGADPNDINKLDPIWDIVDVSEEQQGEEVVTVTNQYYLDMARPCPPLCLEDAGKYTF